MNHVPNQHAVVIIGGGISQLPFILATKDAGFTVIVFDRNPESPSRKYADFFFPLSTHDTDEIVEALKPYRKKIISAFTYSSYFAALRTVATINDYFDLIGLRSLPLSIGSNKAILKAKLSSDGLLAPKSLLVDEIVDLNVEVSVDRKFIVKPSMGACGSAGVNIISDLSLESKEKIREACLLSSDSLALTEEFVDGVEYSVDGYVDDYFVHILLVSRKKTLGPAYGFAIDGFFYDPIVMKEFLDIHLEEISRAVRIVGLKNSFFSFDIIKSDKNLFYIDFGFLLDAKVDLLLQRAGVSIYRVPALIAAGDVAKWEPRICMQTIASSRFVYIKDDFSESDGLKTKSISGGSEFEFIFFDNIKTTNKPPQAVSDAIGLFLSSGKSAISLWDKPWALDLLNSGGA